MTMHNSHINVFDYFNGHLNKEEREAFEKHLNECPECRELLDELHELNHISIQDVELIEPPEGMEDRILNSIFDDVDEKETALPQDNIVENTRNKKTFNRGWIIGLAAALLLSLAGNAYFMFSSSTLDDNVIEIINIQSEEQEEMHAEVELHQLDNGRQAVSVDAYNFTNLEPGQVYQLWLIKDDAPHRAGTLVPNDEGEVTILYTLGDDVEDVDWDQLAVTIETSPHHSLPEGDIIMSSEM